MKALLICPRFFNYEIEIKEGLETAGYTVTYIDEKPYNNAFFKIAVRLFAQTYFIKKILNSYFHRIFDSLIDEYDLVIVIKGESLSEQVLLNLKNKLKSSRFIFYAWDALNNYPHVENYLYLFDRAYTFDDVDALNIPQMEHLPLFYSREFCSERTSSIKNKKPKLVFAGTVHSDRYKILGEIKLTHAQLYDFDYFMYFPSALLLIKFILSNYKNILKYKLFSFSLKAKDKSQLKNFFLNADGVIDIQHPAQRGLTMRTIEIMPLYRKLITTNSQIINYDFYNKDNYLVIDRTSPIIPTEFMLTSFNFSESSKIERYSIDSWITNLCSK